MNNFFFAILRRKFKNWLPELNEAPFEPDLPSENNLNKVHEFLQTHCPIALRLLQNREKR